MRKKEIDYSRYTKKQLEAARLMSDPNSKLTNKEIAEKVGCSERQIYRWKQDADFLALLNDLADKYMDAYIPEVYRELMKAVRAGKVNAIELALKRAGKLVDRRETVSDINVEVNHIEGKTTEQLLLEAKKAREAIDIEAYLVEDVEDEGAHGGALFEDEEDDRA